MLVITLQWLFYSAWALLKTLSLCQPSTPTPSAYSRTVIQHTCPIGRYIGNFATPLQVPQVCFCDPVWSRMSRQLSQLPTPDLPAGASPQFGSCTQPAGSLTGGHLNSMTGLKSLLQHPMKGDQRLKTPCDTKGEWLSYFINLYDTQCCSCAALAPETLDPQYVQCQSMKKPYWSSPPTAALIVI